MAIVNRAVQVSDLLFYLFFQNGYVLSVFQAVGHDPLANYETVQVG